MRTRVDDLLREQAARFSFRFACEDCAHFVPGSPSSDPPAGHCSAFYPAHPRRDALDAGFIELCKEFELA